MYSKFILVVVLFGALTTMATATLRRGAASQSAASQCASQPCQNGGTCKENNGNGNSKYSCQCPTGYSGNNCEISDDESRCYGILKCQNGGNSVVSSTGSGFTFSCTCPQEFGGRYCEKKSADVDECLSNPCQHGGTCTDVLGSFNCTCRSGYSGTKCEIGASELILRNTVASWATKFFNRAWNVYQQGFGTLDSLYWIGLDKLHDLSQRGCAVRFDMKAANGSSFYAQYSTFLVGGSADEYRLILGGYSGNIPDSFGLHNTSQFHTMDHGKLSMFAKYFNGGWWYFGSCAACLTTSTSSKDLFVWVYTELVPNSEATPVSVALNSIEARFAC